MERALADTKGWRAPRPEKSYLICCIYRADCLNAQRFDFDKMRFADALEDASTP